MQIPLQQNFLDLDGNFITQDGKKEGKLLTTRDCCIVALTTEFPEDQTDLQNIVSVKLKRFDLFQRFNDTTSETDMIELSTEDALYLKPRIARCFGVVVCGPILKYLDGK